MTKEQLVKIDPKNLEYCSIELKSLLERKLNDKFIQLDVYIYPTRENPLNLTVEDNSLGGATLFEGYFWRGTSFLWERKSSKLPLCEISNVTSSQLAKIKRWSQRYMEELATYYEEELKGNKNE